MDHKMPPYWNHVPAINTALFRLDPHPTPLQETPPLLPATPA